MILMHVLSFGTFLNLNLSKIAGVCIQCINFPSQAGYVLHDRVIRPAEVGVTVAVENEES